MAKHKYDVETDKQISGAIVAPKDINVPQPSRGIESSTISPDVARTLVGGSVGQIEGNVLPSDVRRQSIDGPVQNITPSPAWTSFTGIGGENIYRNSNVNTDKYGQAIYSDSSLGAIPGGPSGFDASMKQYGVGATGIGPDGNKTGTYTPFSQPIQSPEIQQKPGGIEVAGVNPVAPNAPHGQNQYGNVGQGDIGYQSSNDMAKKIYGSAYNIMENLPYGGHGDRAKRRNKILQARQLMNAGKEYQKQANLDRTYGIDYYNATNPKQKSQIGRYEVVPATEGSYGIDNKFLPGDKQYILDTATGQKGGQQQPDYTSTAEINKAYNSGILSKSKARSLDDALKSKGLGIE